MLRRFAPFCVWRNVVVTCVVAALRCSLGERLQNCAFDVRYSRLSLVWYVWIRPSGLQPGLRYLVCPVGLICFACSGFNPIPRVCQVCLLASYKCCAAGFVRGYSLRRRRVLAGQRPGLLRDAMRRVARRGRSKMPAWRVCAEQV